MVVDARLTSPRLDLDPLRPEDADEMAGILGDQRIYEFIGGEPPTLDELRARYGRLAAGRSADGRQEWHNWIIRQRSDRRAVGTVQATLVNNGLSAEIAWVIGVPWQRHGIASEAAQALVLWLASRGVTTVTAHIHPDHHASASVAVRAGLGPTEEVEDGERVWRLILGSE